MLLFFAMANYKHPKPIDLWVVVTGVGAVVAYLLSLLVLHFMVKRNEISGNNSYVIFSFAVSTAMLPEALVSFEILGANFFILLAFRRIVSLRSQKEVQQKIIDASLWITTASLCYFWSILFFGVLFVGIAYYAFQNYRNWLLPFVGIGAVYILATCARLLWDDTFFSLAAYADQCSIYFSGYWSFRQWLPFLLIFVTTPFFLIPYLLKYKGIQSKTKSTVILVIAMLVVAILIIGVVPQKEASVLFFMTTPWTVMIVSYIESKMKPLWRELLLWLLLILPVILAVF